MKKIILIALVGSVLIFSSCSEQPSCSNSDVKETVLDLVKEKISGELYLAYWQTNEPGKALAFAIEVQALSLAALQKDEEAINSFVSKYEKEMEDNFLNFDPQVSNIRISNKNEDGETFVELQKET